MSVETDILHDHDAFIRGASVRRGFMWFGIAFTCFFTAALIIAPASERQEYLLEHGIPVEATIERSQPGFRGPSKSTLSYYVDGEKYCVCVFDHLGDVGDSVTVYVDPTNPEIFTVEDVLPQGAAGYWGTMVAIVASFGAAFAGFRQFGRVIRRRWFTSPREVPASSP